LQNESGYPGGGTPLFKPGERVKLGSLDSTAHSTGVVILRYAPVSVK